VSLERCEEMEHLTGYALQRMHEVKAFTYLCILRGGLPGIGDILAYGRESVQDVYAIIHI